KVPVTARNQSIHELNDADLASECIVYCSHLKTDDPSTDDQHTLGNICQGQCAGGIHDPTIFRSTRELRGLRASSDDGILETDACHFSFVVSDLYLMWAGELTEPTHHGNASLLRH